MQDAKEEVRARLAIEDVIGEYVELKRAGRNFKGLSPFSGEKTASFIVSPDKQIWHDFSSNRGGDVFSFVMEMEGLEFRETLELLARRAGVELKAYDTKRSGDFAKQKVRLIKAHQLAARYYQQCLLADKVALDYVTKKRGFGRQVISDFVIGYAPESGDGLVKFLTAKGFTAKELSDAGLTNRYGGDLFRGRMMVPLMDPQGQVIGFTGRIIKAADSDTPKYFNTRQTIIYDKGRHVFGLSQAKEAIRKANYAVVTEGNLDVVSSHHAGIKQVVATAGTAMTNYHLKALSRLVPDIKLAFDGDKAGLAATERAIGIAAEIAGLNLTIVQLPDGASDPDELASKSPQAWQQAIDDSVPAVDWVLKQYQNRCDLTTAQGKRQFTSATLEVVKMLTDPVEREYYQKQIAKIADVSFESIQRKLANSGSGQIKKPLRKPAAEPSRHDSSYGYQDAFLALLFLEPGSRSLVNAESIDWIVGENRQAVANYLMTAKQPITELPTELNDYATYGKILLLMAEEHYNTWSSQDRSNEAARLLNQAKNEHRKLTQRDLTERLRDAELAGEEDHARELRVQLNQLIKER